jgi:hypothetical protein
MVSRYDKFLLLFLPGVAGTLRPLTAALSGNPKTLPWTPDMETTFATAKAALPGAVLALVTDASNTHVGAVLQQQVGQHWQPLGFFSKNLSKSEVNYSLHFRPRAPCCRVRYKTLPLAARGPPLPAVDGPQTSDFHPAQGLTADLWPPAAPPGLISEYTNQLVYLPGTFNVVTDALSRPAAAAAGGEWVCAAIADKSPLDLKDMALCQILCSQVQALRSSPGLRIITQKVGNLDLIGDSSTGIFRPLVPRDLR